MANEAKNGRSDALRFVGLRRTLLFVSAAFLITIFIRINDFIDLSETMLERLDFIRSPTLRLAENTARSNFSERLTRLAWRRLYWGRLAAQRVVDEAPIADIDSGWSAYINASADWNAEVMILIVGLERYYSKRREVFETKILNLFNSFDDALRGVRRSAIMRKLRASQAPDELERAEAKELFETYLNRYWDLNVALYDFALCFEPVKRANEHCEYRPIERKQ
jgi:hypothetical protein